MTLPRPWFGILTISALALVGCGGSNYSSGGSNTAASARGGGGDDDSDDSSGDSDDDAPVHKLHGGSAKDKASVHGKYSGLIKTVNVPGDQGTYGNFNDYGEWGPGEWAGEMQPKGYWVYVYPNWYIWSTQGAGGADQATASDDDDADEAPKPKHKKKHKKSSDDGDGTPQSASGSGQGANRDLACASAKLQATQNASCSNIASAIGGAACDCNQIAPTMWMCSTQVTCR